MAPPQIVFPAAVPTPAPTATAEPEATPRPEPLGPGRVEDRAFRSAVLSRQLAMTVYLPPEYDAGTRRYPTLYMLHGGSGFRSEWIDYGLLQTADRLMRERTIAPFIIVLPQGDQHFWVDHVTDASVGANGERWGTYTAREVVAVVDASYRTIARAEGRAIGGLSMGGHAAMQLPLSFPGVWSVLGAHSPSLRPYGDAPTYLGRGAEFERRDPLALIRARTDTARTLTWWIDTADTDPWYEQTAGIAAQLAALGIPREWHAPSGDHSAAYWSERADDYLRYYSRALCARSGACDTSR